MGHTFGQEYNQSQGSTLEINDGDTFENCTFYGIIIKCEGTVRFQNCITMGCTIQGGDLEFYGGSCVNLSVEPKTIKLDGDVHTSKIHIKQVKVSGKGAVGVRF